MFVPHASHFASTIWSPPDVARKKTMPMWDELAKASITPAVDFVTTWFGAPEPALNAAAVYGPCTFRIAYQ
jgi:hypothetical protein